MKLSVLEFFLVSYKNVFRDVHKCVRVPVASLTWSQKPGRLQMRAEALGVSLRFAMRRMCEMTVSLSRARDMFS
jgi:hypothetical protein